MNDDCGRDSKYTDFFAPSDDDWRGSDCLVSGLGETAIPTGLFGNGLTDSPRFGRPKMIIQHPRSADVLAFGSGASFVTSHWFLVADHLVHFGASLVSMITGIAAIVIYAESAYAKVGTWVRKLRGK